MDIDTITADVIARNILFKRLKIILFANDRQENLKFTFHSPLALTAGINWTHRKSSFGVSVQYFGKIAIYDIFKATPSDFIRPAQFNTSLGANNL